MRQAVGCSGTANTRTSPPAVEHAAQLGIDLEIVQRDHATRGFHVRPRRWVIDAPSVGSCTTAASPVSDQEFGPARVLVVTAPDPARFTSLGQLCKVVTFRAGSPAISACVKRSVTHCLREKRRVWSV